MVSTDLLIILLAIVIFCVSGLLYLTFDYFNGRKSSKAKQLLSENKAQATNQILVSPEETRKLTIEKAGQYEDAAMEYYKIGMLDRAKHCRRMAKIEEAENLERAGKYEAAAEKYDELKMWDKAGDCRRMLKTNYVVSANVNIGKAGTISMDCPHCGASQPIATKSNEVTCKFCGKNYVVPKKVLDLL